MTFKTDDDLYRKRIAQWTTDAPQKLSSQSCQTLARKVPFRKFISFIAEQAPGTMGPFLRRVVKKMPVATAEDECNTGSKRSAAEREETRNAKKAKFEKTKEFGCEIFGSSCDFEAGLRGEDGSLDRDKDEQAKFEKTKDFGCGVFGSSCDSGAGSSDEESLFLDAGFLDRDQNDKEKPTKKCPRQLDDYTASEIESGLVEGDSEIWKLFMAEFAKIARDPRDRKDGSRVLEACKKLGIENVVTEVCRVLRTASKKLHSVPQGYDVQDPQKILQTLQQIARVAQELGIHNAYVQMMLATVVNSMIGDKQFPDYKEAISHLADCYVRSPAGQGQDGQQVKNRYCADYNRGHRWLDIAKSFDGTGIVLAIVMTGRTTSPNTMVRSPTNVPRYWSYNRQRGLDGV